MILHVKHVEEEPPQTVRFVHKDILKMVIVVARNVIQNFNHVMEELLLTVRLVDQDSTGAIIKAAKNVIIRV